MDVIIREYNKSDFGDLIKLMEELQDFVIKIDPMKKLRRLPRYGRVYTSNLIKKTMQNQGIIFLAEHQKKVVGCVAGIIEKQTNKELLEWKPTKIGRILELIVTSEYRSQEIGKFLMDKIEKYFKKERCTILKTDVFEPNMGAYVFYKKLNYKTRMIYMIKAI